MSFLSAAAATIIVLGLIFLPGDSHGFAPPRIPLTRNTAHHHPLTTIWMGKEETNKSMQSSAASIIASSLLLLTMSFFAVPVNSHHVDLQLPFGGSLVVRPALAASSTADAKCFINQCGEETKRAFSNLRKVQGIACLGRCPEEDQMCATRCFAEFGSNELNQWLSCTIEEQQCIQFENDDENNKPAVIEKGANSKQQLQATTFDSSNKSIRSFNPATLTGGGTWYKTHGLNPNYDLYACQSYIFDQDKSDNAESILNMAMNFRIVRPRDGNYWETVKTERFTLTPNDHHGQISGKFYGLSYKEDWYLLGEASDIIDNDSNDGYPSSVLFIAYKGRTLRGAYSGASVLTTNPQRALTPKTELAVRKMMTDAHYNFEDFSLVDNHCATGVSLSRQ